MRLARRSSSPTVTASTADATAISSSAWCRAASRSTRSITAATVAPKAREFIADFHALRIRVEADSRGKPLIVLGHSLGGLIVARYLLSHASGLAGAILSSPAFAIADEPPRLLQWIGRILSRIAPRTSFQGTVKPELLSRDDAVGRAYAADPLVHRRATARFFTEFKWAMANVNSRGGEIRLPILVLQAGDDRLVDPRATEAFAAEIAPERKRVRFYPGLYHEIFNETEKDRVFDDLERWLDALVEESAQTELPLVAAR